jgi:hypothetical protein
MGLLSVEQAGLSPLCVVFSLTGYGPSWMKEGEYGHVLRGNYISNKVEARVADPS